jgi:hypothetical protein
LDGGWSPGLPGLLADDLCGAPVHVGEIVVGTLAAERAASGRVVGDLVAGDVKSVPSDTSVTVVTPG